MKDPVSGKGLAASGRIVARYTDGSPNGSADDIAGIASADGNVVGLMPHPEHAIDSLTGPGTGGLAFFSSIMGSTATAGAFWAAPAAGLAESR